MAKSGQLELPKWGIGFYLSTLGYYSHVDWAERLAPLGLDGRQAAILLHIAQAGVQPQQAFATALRIPPSRVVSLVDELEARQLITRRTTAVDRRVRTLHLTNRGRTMVRTLVNVEAAHEQALSVGLDHRERELLVGLLRKAAAGLGLGTVHSGIDAPNW